MAIADASLPTSRALMCPKPEKHGSGVSHANERSRSAKIVDQLKKDGVPFPRRP